MAFYSEVNQVISRMQRREAELDIAGQFGQLFDNKQQERLGIMGIDILKKHQQQTEIVDSSKLDLKATA